MNDCTKTATALRSLAETCRRAASSPTCGGQGTDRLLRHMAYALENKAAELGVDPHPTGAVNP